MPAFSNNDIYEINIEITKRAALASRYTALGMTYDEYLLLFVSSSHREIYHRISDDILRGHAGGNTVFQIPNSPESINIMVRTSDSAPLVSLRPRIQEDAPLELQERFTSWVTNELNNIPRTFGRVAAVVNMLNRLCKSTGQVRYYWPSILQLIDSIPSLREKYSGLHEPQKAPRDGLAFSPIEREALKSAAGTLTAASFIDTDAPWPKHDVTITFAARKYDADKDGEFVTFNGMVT